MPSTPLNVGHGVRLELALLYMFGQDKSIRTKLLKPQKFGRDKDRSDTEAYKANQNDAVDFYYVMVNLYRDMSQSHQISLEAAINAASMHQVLVRVTEHSLAGPSGTSAGDEKVDWARARRRGCVKALLSKALGVVRC